MTQVCCCSCTDSETWPLSDWVPITSAVAATCLGLILIIVLLILCLKWRRRHKWNPLREPPTPEWTPVKSLKYTSLVTDLTKSVPQTLDIGHFRDYPSFDLGESGLKSNVHNLAPRKHKIQPLPLNLYDDDSSHCPRISDSHKTLSKFSSSNTSFLQQLQDKSWKDSSSSSLVTQPVIDDDDDDCYQVVVDDDESTSPDRDSSFEHVPLSDYCDPVTSPTTPEFLPQTWSTPDYHPTIEFCVIYLSSTNVLGVHVKRIINLPPKYQSISIKFKLLSHATGASPQSPTSIYNLKTPKKVFDSENGASVTFPLTSRSELKHYDLYILVFKKRYNRIREKLLGEVIYSMAQIEFCSEIPVTCLEKLTVCSKKRSLVSTTTTTTTLA